MVIPILAIQIATFIALGCLFYATGDWRLGTAQLLLGVVQGVVYSGRMIA